MILKRTIIVLAAFLLYCFLGRSDAFHYLFFGAFDSLPHYFYTFLKNLFSGVPIFIVLFVFYKPNEIAAKVGLKGFSLKWCMLLFACALCAIGGTIAYEYYSLPVAKPASVPAEGLLGLLDLMQKPEITWQWLLKTVFNGFSKQFFVIGFFYTQLFRYLRWGFVPAVLAGLVTVALFDIFFYGFSFSMVTPVVAAIFLNSVLCWVYTEWDYNIWLPIVMVILWNIFSTVVFAFSLPPVLLFIVPVLCLGAILLLTMMYKNKRGLPYKINVRTLFVNRKEAVPVKLM